MVFPSPRAVTSIPSRGWPVADLIVPVSTTPGVVDGDWADSTLINPARIPTATTISSLCLVMKSFSIHGELIDGAAAAATGAWGDGLGLGEPCWRDLHRRRFQIGDDIFDFCGLQTVLEARHLGSSIPNDLTDTSFVPRVVHEAVEERSEGQARALARPH